MKKKQASLAEQETEKIVALVHHNSKFWIIFSSSLCASNPEQTNLNVCLIVWSEIQLTLNKPGEKSKDGVKKRQASLAERETETEKIVTLVHHESWWWSSTHQAQLGLLVEMQQIKTTHIFQNPWVHEDQKEKENRFETRKIFIKKICSSSWDLRAEIPECNHD